MHSTNTTYENKQEYLHSYYNTQAVNSFKYRKHRVGRKGFSVGLSLMKNLTGFSKRFYYQNYFGKFSSQKHRSIRSFKSIFTSIENAKIDLKKKLIRAREKKDFYEKEELQKKK